MSLVVGGVLTGVFLFRTHPLTLSWYETRGAVSEENLLNFPPPHPVKEISTDGQAVVVMTNGSPEPMRVLLRGQGKDYAFQVGPCPSCSMTADSDLAQQFCERGPQEAMSVDPGQYTAFISFTGFIKDARSDWALKPQWEYRQCLLKDGDFFP